MAEDSARRALRASKIRKTREEMPELLSYAFRESLVPAAEFEFVHKRSYVRVPSRGLSGLGQGSRVFQIRNPRLARY